MRNLYIVGAQSTGKTTLVNALENELKANASAGQLQIIREVARKVLKAKDFGREDITASRTRAFQLQQHILEAQYVAETDIGAMSMSSWCICDRSGLDPIVYAKYFVGPEASAEMLSSKYWVELETRMKEGIVVLCEAGSKWLVDDGTRLMPNDGEEWQRLDAAFRKLLAERGIRYSVISKTLTDIDKRVEFVRELMFDVMYEQAS